MFHENMGNFPKHSCIKFVNNDKRMNYLVFDQNYDRLR